MYPCNSSTLYGDHNVPKLKSRYRGDSGGFYLQCTLWEPPSPDTVYEMSHSHTIEDPCPWQTFGLQRGDPICLEIISTKKKSMLIKLHPDKAKGAIDPDYATQMSQRINAAYDVLSNEDNRATFILKGNWKEYMTDKLNKETFLKRLEEDEYRRKNGLRSMDEEVSENLAGLHRNSKPKEKVPHPPPPDPSPKNEARSSHKQSNWRNPNVDDNDGSDTDFEGEEEYKVEKKKSEQKRRREKEREEEKRRKQDEDDERNLREMAERREAEERKRFEEDTIKMNRRRAKFSENNNFQSNRTKPTGWRQTSPPYQTNPAERVEAEAEIQRKHKNLQEQWDQFTKLRADFGKENDRKRVYLENQIKIQKQKDDEINNKMAELTKRESQLQNWESCLRNYEKRLTEQWDLLKSGQEQLKNDQDLQNECRLELLKETENNERFAKENALSHSELDQREENVIRDENNLKEEWKTLEKKEIELDSREHSLAQLKEMYETKSAQLITVPVSVQTELVVPTVSSETETDCLPTLVTKQFGVQTELVGRTVHTEAQTDFKCRAVSLSVQTDLVGPTVSSESQTDSQGTLITEQKESGTQTELYVCTVNTVTQTEYQCTSAPVRSENSAQTNTNPHTVNKESQTDYLTIEAATQYDETDDPSASSIDNSFVEVVLDEENRATEEAVPSSPRRGSSTQPHVQTPQANKKANRAKNESTGTSRSKGVTKKRARSPPSGLVKCGIGGCGVMMMPKPMYNHRLTHQKYQCHICEKTYTRPDILRRHNDEVHKNKKRKK